MSAYSNVPGSSSASPPSGTTREICFFVEAEANSGLLCRLLGLFAQLDLPTPAMRVDVTGKWMAVEARLGSFGDMLVPTVAHKMAGLVGVRAVDIHEVSGRSADRDKGLFPPDATPAMRTVHFDQVRQVGSPKRRGRQQVLQAPPGGSGLLA